MNNKTKNKKWTRIIFSRTGVVLLLALLAIGAFFLVMTFFADLVTQILGGVGLFNLVVIIYLMNTDMDSTAKLTWVLIVSVTSVFGTLFYIYTKVDPVFLSIKTDYSNLISSHKDVVKQDTQTLKALSEESIETAQLVSYLNHGEQVPVSRYNNVEYYPLGERKWEAMLEELKKAEHFIFMEYFIVEDGLMWGKILEVLKEKAAAGVEVRVMYDGTCALSLLPYQYPKMLQEMGIQCKMFSPIRPFLSTHYNYRDHRKILVIDGKTGFCGGVNLADEYINQRDRFGHWKDTAVKIQGEGVKKLTLLFLNMWYYGQKDPEYEKYLTVQPEVYLNEPGYVFPYGVNPFDRRRVGERVYIDILNRADSYVHIMTPYLILDDELLQALKYTAERGVEVKIILPGIPDKKAVYALAKTYFDTLIQSGVQIYLYTPGFVHAKVFVSDDQKAVVGTINLDYRSLYHHFECGVYMYQTRCISDIVADYQQTLEKCRMVIYGEFKQETVGNKILGRCIRLIAPLL